MYPEFKNFHQYFTEKALVAQKDFEKLLPYFSVEKYPKGHTLLSKGGVNKHIYFVEEGLLRFYTKDENGKEFILHFAPENWWLTDRNNLCSNEPSEFFIDAYEETSVVLLNHDFIEKATEISHEFRTFHEHILQRHIKQLYRRINLLISTPAKECYIEFLKTYPNITQRVPQWMIASYLGITPEAVSRIRKELASK
ncbi:MAG: Crp/Fnr family transcriptional regulator [Chitinophagaceae bacterium]|nr:Crp/Fnr family transcriptional regulator [Chitinophagaceae bacterium]